MRRWLGMLCCLWLVSCGTGQPPDRAGFVGTDITGAGLGGPLALTDHQGQPRRLADFRGKVVALFFGYTHCPDVCPTTLDALARAVRDIGPDADAVQVLFVTLDPERDTQQVLAQYVPGFDPRFVGLYGDAAATAKVASDFKVFYQKQTLAGQQGYTLDHSAGVYVFGRDGRIRVFLGHGQSPSDMAHDLRLLLREK